METGLTPAARKYGINFRHKDEGVLNLEEIKKQAVVSGLDAANPVRILATELVEENALTHNGYALWPCRANTSSC